MAVIVTASPAAAANSIDFGGGATGTTVGPNTAVRIGGRLDYETTCPNGVPDFVYPATDVYVIYGPVEDGGVLGDYGGGKPNTIISALSIFDDEVIAITSPAGALVSGTYNVVYDTCQDGRFDAGQDTVFEGAIVVTIPAVLPDLNDPAVNALAELKTKARADARAWVDAHSGLKWAFDLHGNAIGQLCKASVLYAPLLASCALKGFNAAVLPMRKAALSLVLNQANHYLAIADDPPDAAFEQLSVVDIEPFEDLLESYGDSASLNAVRDVLPALASEGALAAALLHAIERYQGAQVAGDQGWGLTHARQAVNLSVALRQQVGATSNVLSGLRDAVGAEGAAFDAASTAGWDFITRVRASGFTPEERRSLLNEGLDLTAISRMETEVRDIRHPSPSASELQTRLNAVVSAHGGIAGALDASAAGWQKVVARLEEQGPGALTTPVADAGGPYTVGETHPLVLDGSGSTTAAGTTLTDFAWDLDADGAFDDASGERPAVSFPTQGSRVVGVRTTDSGGRRSVAYTTVAVDDVNRAPTLASSAPSATTTTVVVGSPATFSVAAADPEGAPVSYEWRVDGGPVMLSGPTFPFDPPAAAVGQHTVEVTVSDGTVAGGTTRRSWNVIVVLADGDGDAWTATTDCDEKDRAVHPGANELLGNGVDDDSDQVTPDAPPGGLTGSAWGWGMTIGVGNGKASHSNTFTPTPDEVIDQDDAVQVESAYAGYAVRANGEVLAWGSNYAGQLGDGTTTTRVAPVSPVAAGGGGGRLSGVTQLSEGNSVLARRSDGTVVAWGENRARQLGDGSTVSHRVYPVPVLAGPDGAPLANVRAVEASDNPGGSYAVMDDGTVRAWGQIRCDGRTNLAVSRIEPYPVPLPLVGGDVRQVAAGLGGALILKKDGTVLSCGVSYLGRPVDAQNPPLAPLPVTGFGPGSGVVAVSAGMDSGLALKADGTVWAWGQNSNGSLSPFGVALGNSAAGQVPTPRQVPLPPGPPVVAVDNDYASHSLVLRADGSVLAWGANAPMAQTGIGQSPSDIVVETPTVVNLPGRATIDIAATTTNSLVLTRPLDDASWERPATWVNASVDDAHLAETVGGSFRLSTSFALPYDVAVDWSLTAGTAGADDVALGSGTATIPAGATAVDVAVGVVDDAVDEDDETFSVVLTDASHGIRLSRPQATATITDDDDPPSLSVSPAQVTEGHTSLTDAQLSVSLSAPSAKSVTVTYATTDGTATAPADYGTTTGTVHIAPGQTTATIHTAVHGDTAVEPEESFAVTLSSPENATLGAAAADLTIVDDDALVAKVASPTVTEGTGGTTAATVEVSLEPPAPPGTQVSMTYRIEGLTATVPDDVAADSGTLTFGPGEGPKQVAAMVEADALSEPTEAFRLVLGDPEVVGGRPVLVGDNPPAFIVDDDVSNRPPSCAAVAADATSLWPANHRLVPVTLSGATDPDGDPTALAVTGVTQDEPVEGLGDGDVSPDARLGPGPDQVRLRAERSGTGDGRVYRLTVTATDPTGAGCTTTVIVTVPHNRGSTAIDSGGGFNSAGS